MRLFGNTEKCKACGHECHCGGACKQSHKDGDNQAITITCCQTCTCQTGTSEDKKMTERFCKKCNKICHCPNAEGECTNCECNSRAEDKSFENEGGLVIDDTGECESCQ